MISRIARFYKVSFEQFKGDWVDTFEEGDEDIQAIYDSIRLPERATAGSAGYDFFAPRAFVIKPGETIKNSYRYPGGDRRGLGADLISKEQPGF